METLHSSDDVKENSDIQYNHLCCVVPQDTSQTLKMQHLHSDLQLSVKIHTHIFNIPLIPKWLPKEKSIDSGNVVKL